MHRLTLLVGLAVLTPSLAGCTGQSSPETSPVLRLAVTTSTRDSGLLDLLVPVFEKEHNFRVDVIGAGTGKALKLGEMGDVDVVLVHDRAAEDAFMAAAHGIRREDVMANYFEVLGPSADPAGVQGVEAADALQRIAEGQHPFVSRGDESGTHRRELALWKLAGGRPIWDRYVETGRGMGPTLVMADQMNAYVLTDRGTFLAFKHKIDLRPLAAVTEELRNPYGIIVVNPEKNDQINVSGAHAFVAFMIAPQTQKMIGDFTIDGERLFYPFQGPAPD